MRSRSPATFSPSLQGLVVVALAGIIWMIAGSSRFEPPASRAGQERPPDDCIYQVFRDEVCLGTLFSRNQLTLREILQRAGCPHACHNSLDTGVVPCDRAVILHGNLPSFSVRTMRGGNLLIAGRRIDLNLADYGDLLEVPGIGKHLAEAIISDRERRGPFSSLHELTRIAGIGPGKLSAVGRYLRIEPSEVP